MTIRRMTDPTPLGAFFKHPLTTLLELREARERLAAQTREGKMSPQESDVAKAILDRAEVDLAAACLGAPPEDALQQIERAVGCNAAVEMHLGKGEPHGRP